MRDIGVPEFALQFVKSLYCL